MSSPCVHFCAARAAARVRSSLAPLGALAAGFGLSQVPVASWAGATPSEPAEVVVATESPADPAAAGDAVVLRPVTVTGTAERRGSDAYQARTTTAGKGRQALRDIPQSVTVVTEKLMDDRNYDTLKGALHSVTGIAFEAGEGGAIGDLIRLRGFSTRGDIFQDGLRDIAQYNRDTFNQDRVEVLRGSASMLYGRGSTGGIVNQVSKQPMLLDRQVVDLTAGTDDYLRFTGDFNLITGEDAALRINVMRTKADSFRNGPSTDRQGIAPTYRFGIGTRDEFAIGFYHLSYDDVPDYGFRFLNGRPVDAAVDRWYGFASDYQKDSANQVNATHLHRFDGGGELKTTFREGRYKRDLWATTAGLSGVTDASQITDATTITRGSQTRAAKDKHRFLQTDYSGAARWLGLQHALLAGAEASWEDTTTTTYAFPLAPGSSTVRINPKGPTTWGAPGPDPALEDTRSRAIGNVFRATTLGAYVQDTVQITPHWKLLAGLRFDRFDGDYERATGGPLSRTDRLWSRRFGAIYQPSGQASYYVSYSTSFNASGDLYQFDDRSVNTPPERSRNLEAGAKWELAEGALSLRTAVFRTEKYNERNTDVFQGADEYLLNGRRHTDGLELEAAGRPAENIEVFGGVAYMRGKIDAAGSSAASQASVGKDSGLTPRWTGNLWVTWQLTPKWRVGLGADGMSDRLPAQAETGANRAPGYVKADALIEYATGPYSLKLNLINLFDKVYADGVYRGFTVPGPTRGAQMTVSAAF